MEAPDYCADWGKQCLWGSIPPQLVLFIYLIYGIFSRMSTPIVGHCPCGIYRSLVLALMNVLVCVLLVLWSASSVQCHVSMSIHWMLFANTPQTVYSQPMCRFADLLVGAFQSRKVFVLRCVCAWCIVCSSEYFDLWPPHISSHTLFIMLHWWCTYSMYCYVMDVLPFRTRPLLNVIASTIANISSFNETGQCEFMQQPRSWWVTKKASVCLCVCVCVVCVCVCVCMCECVYAGWICANVNSCTYVLCMGTCIHTCA